MRSIPIKFKRGDSVRRDVERVVRKIKDIHNRSKPRKRLKTYEDAKKGVRDFVVVIQEYSQEAVTASGVDRLKDELEKFARQFPSTMKTEWTKVQQRDFASDVRKLRKSLDLLKPKKGRKKNPCIGLHFHGKDTDELLKALEKSAGRQGELKENPKKKKASKKKPAKKKSRGSNAISDREFWKQIDALNWPKLRKIHMEKGLSWDECNARLLKKKPLAYWQEILRIGRAKAAALEEHLDLGSNDFAIDFSADIVGHGKRMYDRMMSDPKWAKKQLDSEKYGLENFFYIFPHDETKSAKDVTKRELAESYRKLTKNPKKKKKAPKKKRKGSTPASSLINRCQKLWDEYCDKPTKKRLRAVLEHLDKMKTSTSKTVKAERSQCLRVANREAKRLKLK